MTGMICDWIYSDNLKPLVEILSRFAGYEFDGGDWTALEFGVIDTNYEQDRWFRFEFVGSHSIRVEFAMDPGSEVLFVRIESDWETAPQIDVIVPLLQSYRLLSY
jgi:hypothetical protein